VERQCEELPADRPLCRLIFYRAFHGLMVAAIAIEILCISGNPINESTAGRGRQLRDPLREERIVYAA
jgi:hypothetical protein